MATKSRYRYIEVNMRVWSTETEPHFHKVEVDTNGNTVRVWDSGPMIWTTCHAISSEDRTKILEMKEVKCG